MKEKYYAVISLLIMNEIIFAQGVDFPSDPDQVPISGLGILIAGGAALAYKKLKNKQ